MNGFQGSISSYCLGFLLIFLIFDDDLGIAGVKNLFPFGIDNNPFASLVFRYSVP